MILATATIDENFEGKKLKTILEVDLNFIKYSTFEGIKTVASNKLTQKYIISPNELKSGHLLNILKENPSHKIIVFNKNCKECTLMTETLKKLNFNAICLHSMMKMNQRIANLGKYRNG